MGPVFWEPSDGADDASGPQVCVPRGTYANARWLVAETTSAAPALSVVEVPTTDWYRVDADGETRSPTAGAPACMATPVPPGAPLFARAVDPNGRSSRSLRLAADLDRKFGLLGVVQARLPESDGLPSNAQPVTGTTRWVFETGALDEDAVIDDERAQVTSTRLTLELRHRTAPLTSPNGVPYQRPSTFKATWSMKTTRGSVVGSAEGEAIYANRRWHFRGATLLSGGAWTSSVLGAPNPAVDELDDTPPPTLQGEPIEALRAGTSDAYGVGGFTATLSVNGRDNTDDSITWRPEAFVNVD